MKKRAKGYGAFVEYWEKTVPWTFHGERVAYEERRLQRYALQDYMQEAIPFGAYRGKRVLEIGSGGGIDSAEFGRHGAEVVSLDFTEKGAKSTRDTVAEAGVSSSDVIRGAAQTLPFRDGVFDCVYSFGVLHHIPRVRLVVEEISRALGKKGEFICMLYNKDSLLYAYSILFLHRRRGAREDKLVSMYSERVEGCPYTKAYTKKEAIDLVDGDFHDISTSVHYDVIDTVKQRKVKVKLPDDYELGWHIIVRGKKKPKPSKSGKIEPDSRA